MATFFEQLRDHLHPRFELERELGSGGMGEVYLAHDPRLRRAVAVKVIPPEKASAAATQRFTHEARSLAELKHKNIVTVYEYAPEDSPFFYFIMEYLEGETLEQRLARGPLSLPEVVKLGRELIAALGAAHRRGVIHRDIKPSNIFLEPERAVLTDFGIAKSAATDSSASTKTGQFIGTAKYMAPEQWQGRAVPQSDFYSLGLVLYEAITRDNREETIDRENARWSAVPSPLRQPLRRALAPAPPDRWPDAESFDRALGEPRSSFPVPEVLQGWSTGRRMVAAGAVVAAGLALWLLLPRGRLVDVQIARPSVSDGAISPLGDSIAQSVAERLRGFPDFSVAGPVGRWRAKAVVAGAITLSGQSLTVGLDLPPGMPIVLSTPRAAWRDLSDPLADSLLVRLYHGSPLDSQLPERVFPKSPAGMRVFLDAERAFARASWDSAYIKYRLAQMLDSTCALCAWRHWEVGKFISVTDTIDERVFRSALDKFPAHYQALIRAELVPISARLDSFAQVTKHWPKFLFASFRRADELVHRGPLIGRPRREAAIYFQRSIDVRRDFAPAWEHLLWLWIAEGNERDALVDLDTLNTLVPVSGPATASRDLLQGAFAWRFLPVAVAAQRTAAIIGPAHARHEPLDAGARYFNAFDAQQGAVWLGAWLDSANDHRESALLAQMFGYFGLGRPQQARAVQARLHELFADPEVDLFALELDAMQLMFDPDSSAATQWPQVAQQLREFGSGVGAELRPRAGWMAGLLASRFGHPSGDAVRGAPAHLPALVLAAELARGGDYATALARTDRFEDIEAAGVGDPFFRTALHLLRAEWNERRGQTLSADRELNWYENTDVIELPSGSPQPAEVDWAFGVLARWRRASLGTSQDRCRWYADVARLWDGGEPRYAARADSARRALTALRCPASPS